MPIDTRPERQPLAGKSALVIGVGGLGCPMLMALAGSGLGRVALCDDDSVALSNLHRQLLFDTDDVGLDKLTVAARKLRALDGNWRIEALGTRFLPDNALELARSVDIIVEGADNFATKFLAADAAFLAGRPVVHGAAVRWTATVLSVAPRARPCYRCLFEDVPPRDVGLSCDEAGVMGPVLGLAGALMADLTLSLLSGDTGRAGHIHAYDGTLDKLRRIAITPRAECALCGRVPRITDINEARYLAPTCAA